MSDAELHLNLNDTLKLNQVWLVLNTLIYKFNAHTYSLTPMYFFFTSFS